MMVSMQRNKLMENRGMNPNSFFIYVSTGMPIMVPMLCTASARANLAVLFSSSVMSTTNALTARKKTISPPVRSWRHSNNKYSTWGNIKVLYHI